MKLGKYSGFWGGVNDALWAYWLIVKVIVALTLAVLWVVGATTLFTVLWG